MRSAASLFREASDRQLVEMVPGDEALALQEADSGVVRLRAGDPFSEEMSALWLGVQSLAFTLVCEPHENLLLAEGTLRNLTRHCLEHLHMLGQGSEVSAAAGCSASMHCSVCERSTGKRWLQAVNICIIYNTNSRMRRR